MPAAKVKPSGKNSPKNKGACFKIPVKFVKAKILRFKLATGLYTSKIFEYITVGKPLGCFTYRKVTRYNVGDGFT